MSLAPIAERPRFWSDDFDMDLLKVFPDVARMLRAPDRLLWTVGHTTHGRLNHPTVWNSHGAFLWLTKPELARDENGWFNVDGCVDDAPEIECTWMEWLRDAWVHSYGTLVLPHRRLLPEAPRRDFDTIMYDRRGWRKQDVTGARKQALQWLIRCDFILHWMSSSPEAHT